MPGSVGMCGIHALSFKDLFSLFEKTAHLGVKIAFFDLLGLWHSPDASEMLAILRHF